MLKAANLTATQQVVDGVEPLNTVTKVVGVKPGASVQEGTPVVLQTSNNQLFVVPNLANLSTDDAASQLNTLGWTGSANSFQKYASPSTDGTLIGKIASGPQEVTNPDGNGTTQKPGQDPAVGTPCGRPRRSRWSSTARSRSAFRRSPRARRRPATSSVSCRIWAPATSTSSPQKPAPSAALANTYISMTPNSGSVVDYDTADHGDRAGAMRHRRRPPRRRPPSRAPPRPPHPPPPPAGPIHLAANPPAPTRRLIPSERPGSTSWSVRAFSRAPGSGAIRSQTGRPHSALTWIHPVSPKSRSADPHGSGRSLLT